ncbi:MAG: preprotein translocase subunit SecG [Actinomycetota bacterium]|nr:preprotein translocase subunit SecG [Actinomycetota bacterium]
MDVLKYAILVMFFISAMSMTIFVLLHSGRGGGLSGAFGGSSMSGPSGTQIVQKNLDRITIASSIIFVITTIVLIFIYK